MDEPLEPVNDPPGPVEDAPLPRDASPAPATDPPVPDVSVVVGAYDAMPYLVRCLESVESQTIGPGRMELLAVDDGSADGTGEYLEEFAARSAVPTTVVRQPNSGGPGGPRNKGLALARGRYVFFLDADDFLGDEALERMVAVADRAGTDVVLGRMAGRGRGVPRSMFARNEERADVRTSRVVYALSAQKLFRRALLTRLGLTFDERFATGEDALFTMEAYLAGSGVSVVADYDCYYLVGREDGKHATRRGGWESRFAAVTALAALIARLEPPGPGRDLLMVRPFTVGLLQQFSPALLRRPEAEQRERLRLAALVTGPYWNRGVAAHLKVAERLVLECVARGRLDLLKGVLEHTAAGSVPRVVRRRPGGRVYLALPYFGDRRAGLPARSYRVTVPDWSGTRRVLPPEPGASPLRATVRRIRRRAAGISVVRALRGHRKKGVR
ncbi:glycosyltransferase family 2 protein [Streptomyces zhihengii]|uniref:Glycosyltransferase family 2 protein n=1 Tax=Streptomyces zhihengii TaxID=1818004 RepID=A0ABS2UVM0_9ACTN|nr:glycosyltransferase family A protein [Streptomyces zhihengii]MBM9621621.1 glycosyltransferase family 2 protein [Streptomyces zhihengii]